MKRHALFLALTAISSSALADHQYKLEIADLKSTLKYDLLSTADTEIKGREYNLTYFLDPVKTDGKPYRLAAFLNHSSLIMARYERNKPTKPQGLDTEKQKRIGADIAVTDTDFRVAAVLDSAKAGSEDSATTWMFAGGWYTNPNGLLSMSINTVDGKSSGDDLSGDAISAAYQQAVELNGSYLAFVGAYQTGKSYLGPYPRSTRFQTLHAEIGYFPTREFGIGAEFTQNIYDYENWLPSTSNKNYSYKIGITYDLSEGLGLSLDYGKGSGTRSINVAPNNLNYDTAYTEAKLTLHF